MINWEYADLFNGSHDKQWLFIEVTTGAGINMTNDDIVSESIVYDRGMCESDVFQYGTYYSASFKVNVFRTDERFVGKKFIVIVSIEGHSLNIGVFKCYSDKLSSDRRSRELIMYDDLYQLNELDVAGWYNHFWDSGEDMTLIQFRQAFFSECLHMVADLTDTQGTALPNDFVYVKKAADFRTLSASTVLKSILQINCVNGHISCIPGQGDSVFRWVRIKNYYIHGAPPEPLVIDIVPDATLDASKFYNCNYEEYQVWYADRTGIIIDPDNVILAASGSTSPLPAHDNNTLYLSYDNLFMRNLPQDDLSPFMYNLYNNVHNRIAFTPAQIQMRGNLCYEPGDVIEVDIDGKTIYTVIIKQTITGVQGLTMTLSCQGDEYFSNPLSVESDFYDDYAGSASQTSGSVEYIPITLLAANWDSISKQQTVAVPGVVADETYQLIQPVPKITSLSDYMSSQILCINQGEGELTFSYNTAPSNNIDLFVVLQSLTLSARSSSEPDEEEQEEET